MANVFINEFHYDNADTDEGEFIEIAGPAGTDLSGWQIVLYNGSNGKSYETINLSGQIDDEGNGFGALSFARAGIQNGSPDGFALVDSTGSVVQFLSYEGVFDADDGPASGMTSVDVGVEEAGTTPAGHSLQLSGTGTTSEDFSWSAPSTNSAGSINAGQTFGSTGGGDGDGNDGGDSGNAGEPTLISAIQGSGVSSNMVGQTVTVEAIVVGDFQNGDADTGRSLGGFYLQEEDDDADGDASTSEGLFVFDSNFGTDVQIGDKVRVTGTVTEYFGETQLSDISAVEVVSSDETLPTAAVIDLSAVSATTQSQNGDYQPDLEAFEGMRVVLPNQMTIVEQFQLDRFNEIRLFDTKGFEQAGPKGTTLTGERPFQYTQYNDPSAEGNEAYLKTTGARSIVYDDGLNQQNQPITNLDGFQNYSTATAPSMGDTVTGLAGILDYKWAGNSASGATWRVRSAEDETNSFDDSNPRPDETVTLDGGIKVASFNVLNFFTTLDQFTDSGDDDVGPDQSMEPRGADANPQDAVSGTGTTAEYDRQLAKLVEAVSGLNADIVGLVELENDFLEGGASPGAQSAQGDRGIAINAIVEALNAAAGSNVWTFVDPGQEFVGDDAIATGMIYRTDKVAIADGTNPAILTDADVAQSIIDLSTTGGIFNGANTSRSPIAATFSPVEGGEELTVVVNHFKSKGGSGNGLDADAGDGAGNYNHQRVLTAEALVDWLETNPTGSDTGNQLLLGDFNAYASEEPIDYLTANGFVDILTDILGSAYSYVFDGLIGTLDYAFASLELVDAIIDAVEWHINADEADALDYNLDFGRDPTIFDGDVPFRASDHDPVVVSLDLSGEETPLNVSVYDGPSFDGQILPTKNIELESLSQTDLAGAEIAAYDAGSKQLLVTSSVGLQYLNITNPSAPSLVRTVELGDITSVAAKNGIIAVALPAETKTDAGQVVFLNAAGDVLGSVNVGSLPDMLTFTPDGSKVLVANEGEPSEGFAVNPKGSISIIDLSIEGDDFSASVRTADFTAFDGQENALRSEGVRIFEGQSVSDDVEPEYIAVTPDGTKALVTLQEANAVAIVDIASATVSEIVPLGGKSFANLLADFSDRDGAGGDEAINLTTGNPVIGQFMPDAISSYTAGDGNTYFVTANEGDDRDDFLSTAETIRLKDGDYKLDPDTYPNAAELKDDADLGRLNVSNAALLNGDTDGDGDVDQILTYGARSFSILDADGKMIFDSGDAIERIVATEFPELFDDGRSDSKGPEPEGVTVAEIGGRSYAFVGLERSNLSLVFDVTDPTNVTYTTAATTDGDEAPEGTLVISAADSPTGEALYISPNEASNTLSIYEATVAEPEPFTLELLHFSDQEGAANAIEDAPNLSAVLNALRAQDLGNDGIADNTLTISSGDLFIPGIFGNASTALYGAAGIADIQIQNELGIQASALGNHDFDYGTAALAGLISGSAGEGTSAGGMILGKDFSGTAFPYLSSNLIFSTDANLAPLEVEDGQAPRGNVVTSSVVIDVNGETIGVVGATTPILDSISSTGGVGILPEDFGNTPTSEQLDALAAVIQAEVDALLEANPDMDKVILSSHMQQISIEEALATRLHDVDIIIAGGSDTRLLDDNDRPRDDQSSQGQYPFFTTDADGHPIAVVNTDGQYQYVGRLVIEFDENGHLVTDSYDDDISGAYATDDAGVEALGAGDMVDPEIQAIIDQMEDQIIATESNVFGLSDVFLNGNRSGTGSATDPDGVRTQETNLGDLTADANLAYANEMAQKLGEEAPVLVSIKNGGGIRASIGETVVPPGGTEAVRTANEALVDGEGNIIKPEGGISQTDIQGALAFNNSLSLVTLTRAELVAVLEHGVAALPSAGGQFAQIAGIEMSFDPTRGAGDRIINAAIVDENGDAIANLVVDGEIAGDPGQSFRVVTLGFLADGGDNYPFPTGDAVNRVDLIDLDGDGNADDAATGDATFAFDGTEQDAFAEYLYDNYLETPYSVVDQGPLGDIRIQNLALRDDVVSLIGTGDGGNSDSGGDGVTGGGSDPVIDTGTESGDVFENPTFPGSIDGGAGIDRVSLPNAYSDYVLTPVDGGFALALASDPSEVIDLSNVEVLQFGDLTLERNDSPEAATIYGLYGSIFGRTPDLTGISFWVDANENGVSLETVAEFFTQSAEFIATYGTNPTDDALVDGFFDNILGRSGDAEGEAFWKEALDKGLSTADLLLGFAQSSEFVGLIDNQIDDGIFVIQ